MVCGPITAFGLYLHRSPQLHRAIFTHCAPPIAKEAPQLTMQVLLSSSIPSSIPDGNGVTNVADGDFQRYVTACGNLLNLFGHASNLRWRKTETSPSDPAEDSEYQGLVKAVGNSVLQMANILHIHKLVRDWFCEIPIFSSLTWRYRMTAGCRSV